ncbi:hypothetical protein QR680_015174 [Steinernema hermaphroditum]|uniref:Thioredoxin domain-containing protein n=1 Tax=Steinernema hermaphroditum TaxID=289476 RepID=A0AA39IE09_9BILA|nr:hypothetical protein QR680_015174 [Steinernema hermaphroditum]
MRLFLLLPTFVVAACAQCTRKVASNPDIELGAKPPSQLSPDHYIQSTFIHRNLNDDDKSFSSAVSEKIGILRERLRAKARLSIDNENIDCTKDEFSRCKEFPSDKAYHFLIVEDSSKGAAIYSVDRKPNEKSDEKIEMALLDVLSRHSKVPLMEFGSPNADKILGFVRELTTEEIQQFEADKIEKSRKKSRKMPFFSHSPFELDLIEPHILEFRMADFPETPSAALKVLNKDSLKQTVETNPFVFVLYWTNVQISSIHAHHLWSKAAEKAVDLPAVFATIPCHQLGDYCIHEGIGDPEHHYTVVAYKNGERYATTKNMKDDQYYYNWAKMLINGPMIKVHDLEELKEARKGRLALFEGTRPAITVGVFPTEEAIEFNHFEKAAQLLNGRYHIVYFINEEADKSTISTFRPHEKTKRSDYTGPFDPRSVIEHITSASVPTVIDIGKGFTPDLVRSALKTTLLIHWNWERIGEYVDYAAKHSNANNIFMVLNRGATNILPHLSFLEKLNLTPSEEPVLVMFKKNSFRILPIDQRSLKAQTKDLEEVDPPQIMLKPNEVNPFKYLHTEAINAIFGHQDVMLLPDPVVASRSHSHGLEAFDFGEAAAAGGCPMMAHMNQMRDEL